MFIKILLNYTWMLCGIKKRNVYPEDVPSNKKYELISKRIH